MSKNTWNLWRCGFYFWAYFWAPKNPSKTRPLNSNKNGRVICPIWVPGIETGPGNILVPIVQNLCPSEGRIHEPLLSKSVVFAQVTQCARNIPLVSIVWLTWSNCLSQRKWSLGKPFSPQGKWIPEENRGNPGKVPQTWPNNRKTVVLVFFWHPFKKDKKPKSNWIIFPMIEDKRLP